MLKTVGVSKNLVRNGLLKETHMKCITEEGSGMSFGIGCGSSHKSVQKIGEAMQFGSFYIQEKHNNNFGAVKNNFIETPYFFGWNGKELPDEISILNNTSLTNCCDNLSLKHNSLIAYFGLAIFKVGNFMYAKKSPCYNEDILKKPSEYFHMTDIENRVGIICGFCIPVKEFNNRCGDASTNIFISPDDVKTTKMVSLNHSHVSTLRNPNGKSSDFVERLDLRDFTSMNFNECREIIMKKETVIDVYHALPTSIISAGLLFVKQLK